MNMPVRVEQSNALAMRETAPAPANSAMNMKTLRATLRALDPAYRINPTPDALTVDVLGKTVLIGSGYSLINLTKAELVKRIERAGK